MILDKEKIKEFHEISKPLVKFLNDNCHPHVTVITDSTSSQLFEGICNMYTEEFIKD